MTISNCVFGQANSEKLAAFLFLHQRGGGLSFSERISVTSVTGSRREKKIILTLSGYKKYVTINRFFTREIRKIRRI